MKKDLLIFFKYVFNIKGFLLDLKNQLVLLSKDLKSLSYIIIAFAIYSYLRVPGTYKIPTTILLLIMALILQLRHIYKSGEHRHWERKRRGITKEDEEREELEENRKLVEGN